MKNNSKKYKKETKRLCITMKRNSKEVPSTWEMTKFIDNFSSNYSKILILNQISYLINNGIMPENIFILDNSYSVQNTYSQLDKLNLRNKISPLYSIGVPIGLYPSMRVNNINALFKFFRVCNEVLFRCKTKRLPIKSIDEFVSKIDNTSQSIENILKSIYEKTKESIDSSNNITRVEKEKQHKELDSYLSKEMNLIKKFDSDSTMFLSINQTLSDNETIDSKNSKEILEKYYSKFFYFLSKVQRPLVCVIDENDDVLILGVGNINKKKRDNTFVDLKSISHNSEVVAKIIMGLTAGATTIYSAVHDETRKKEIHQLQKKKLEKEIELLDLKSVETKLDIIEKARKLSSEFSDTEFKNIEIPFIQEKIETAVQNSQNSIKNVLYSNKYSIIDLKVEESGFDYKI